MFYFGWPEKLGDVGECKELSQISKTYINSNPDPWKLTVPEQQFTENREKGENNTMNIQDEINSLYHSSEVILDSCSRTTGQMSCWHFLLPKGVKREHKRQKSQTSFKKRTEDDFVKVFQFPFHTCFEGKQKGSLSQQKIMLYRMRYIFTTILCWDHLALTTIEKRNVSSVVGSQQLP